MVVYKAPSTLKHYAESFLLCWKKVAVLIPDLIRTGVIT